MRAGKPHDVVPFGATVIQVKTLGPLAALLILVATTPSPLLANHIAWCESAGDAGETESTAKRIRPNTVCWGSLQEADGDQVDMYAVEIPLYCIVASSAQCEIVVHNERRALVVVCDAPWIDMDVTLTFDPLVGSDDVWRAVTKPFPDCTGSDVGREVRVIEKIATSAWGSGHQLTDLVGTYYIRIEHAGSTQYDLRTHIH